MVGPHKCVIRATVSTFVLQLERLRAQYDGLVARTTEMEAALADARADNSLLNAEVDVLDEQVGRTWPMGVHGCGTRLPLHVSMYASTCVHGQRREWTVLPLSHGALRAARLTVTATSLYHKGILVVC